MGATRAHLGFLTGMFPIAIGKALMTELPPRRGLRAVADDLTTRHGRINALIDVIGAKSYLEIGVHKGKTFRHIRAAKRVAVDPLFVFDIEGFRNENTLFFSCTSDEFFQKHATAVGPFDFIYLDGLHTFEQTFRDLISSLSLCHRRSLILIDDTMPINIASADKFTNVHALKRILSIPEKDWMGDVFKVTVAAHDFMPLWDYATFPGHGQTLLAYSPREAFKPEYNELSAISRMSFADFLLLKDRGFFKIAETPEKVVEWIRSLAP